MKKLSLAIAVFTITALSISCGGDEAQKSAASSTPAPSNKLSISGSTTLLPAMQKAVEAFQKRQPEIKTSLTGGGSLSGINALTDGYGDIAMSSREMKKEEKEKLQKKKMATKETIIAWDAVIPIVHPSNSIKDLTLAQLKDIYTGKVTDWKQIGGKPGAIIIFARDFTSGTHEAWDELVLNNEPVVKTAQEKASSEIILEMVASTPNGIGYDSIDYVGGNTRVKPITVDGKTASTGSIMDKSYKISRPLYLFTRENPNSAVVEFLKFITSPEGQALVKEAKLVPIK